METNLYAPPVAEVADVPEVAEGQAFFVVGLAKYIVLYGLTLGLYQVVMYYLHWARFKRATKTPMWPVARAIFAVFFIHSLAEEVDHRIRRAGIRHDWSPKRAATVVVVLMIALRIIDRLGDAVMSDATALGITVIGVGVAGAFLWQIQRAANIACGDPDGASNRRLTLVNWLWVVPLALFWLMALVGLSLPEEV